MSSGGLVPKKPPGSSTRPVVPNLTTLPRVGGATAASNSDQPQTARRPSTKDAISAPPINEAGSQSARQPAAPAVDPTAREWTGREAAREFDSSLTTFEKSEVLEFEKVYYCGERCSSKIQSPVNGGINYGFDDDRGDYMVVAKDHIMYRYEVLSLLGRGSFGQVVKAIDHKTQQPVALKIIRNKKKFHQQAQVEVRVLAHLRDRDPDSKYGIIKMTDAFQFRSHVCLTYELLSMNLYEYMKMNRFYPMPLTVVKKIGASLLISLAFMWRENIIHCDLKPENILLRQPNRTGVKVIDLGSACFENERIYTYIQSRFYRAPEVILNLGYSRRIDLWSYACVLCELATGYPLFPGESEVEQLACIMEVMGPPPNHLLEKSPKVKNFFDVNGDNFTPRLVPNSRKRVRHPGTKTLEGFLGLDASDPFVDFINLFLRWDPDERPQPEAAMRHPWICDAYVGVTPKTTIGKRKSEHKHNPKPPSAKDDRSQAVPHLPSIHSKGTPRSNV